MVPRQMNLCTSTFLVCPIRKVGGLVFHSWIPPPVKMDDMGGRGEIEPGAPGFEREHEERDVLILLEPTDQILALLDFCLAMQDEAGPPEHGAQERQQWRRRLPKLGEDKRLLLPGGDHLRDVAQ